MAGHTNAIPYALTRVGVIMSPDPADPLEAEGVLNPGSGRGPDGELYLLPRMVAEGNVSRIGLARVIVENGMPVGVERQGVVLAPDRGWERGVGNAGVEDPRVTQTYFYSASDAEAAVERAGCRWSYDAPTPSW